MGTKDLDGGKYSLGKQIGRFRVLRRADLEVIDFKDALRRNSYYVALFLLAAIPCIPAADVVLVLVAIGIDALVITASPDGRRLGDFIADTQVVPIKGDP